MSNNGIYLSDEQQQALRSRGILLESEVAMKRGDIVIAVSAFGGNERIVGYAKDVLTESRQVLKG